MFLSILIFAFSFSQHKHPKGNPIEPLVHEKWSGLCSMKIASDSTDALGSIA